MYEFTQEDQQRLDRLQRALEEIKREQGKVCEGFALCKHTACISSYSSWAIADAALTVLAEDDT